MEDNYHGMVLKAFRLVKDISTKELAERINLNRPYISDVEAGRKTPKFNTLLRFSEGLQVPVGVITKFIFTAKQENLSYVQILKLCVDYECERLNNQERSV